MPGVAISPSPVIIAVCASTSSWTPSCISGLPARPTPTTRPSLMPMLVLRTPRIGSSSSTPSTIMSSWESRPALADTSAPCRAVLPQPPSSSSPGSVSSASTCTHRSVSASRTRSPVVGPYNRAYSARLIAVIRYRRSAPRRSSAVRKLDHGDLACVGYVHPQRGAGRQVQPVAARRVQLHPQRAVQPVQRDVRGHPDGQRAGVAQHRGGPLPAGGQLDLALTGAHRAGPVRRGGAERGIHVYQHGAVREQRLHLQRRHGGRYPVDQLVGPQHGARGGHHLLVGHVVPGQLADLVADQRDRLRCAQPGTPGQSTPGQLGAAVQQESLPLSRGQVHEALPRGIGTVSAANTPGGKANPPRDSAIDCAYAQRATYSGSRYGPLDGAGRPAA